MSIVRIKKSKEYFAASNVPFNDKRLSWEARGMIGYLLSKPDDWSIRFSDLEKQSEAGGHKVRRILKELETNGYLQRQKLKREDGTFYWISTVFETPAIYQLSTCGLSIDGLSTCGKVPHIDKTDLPSTDSLITEKAEEASAADKFPIVQKWLEVITGLPATGQQSVKAINEIIALEAQREDIEAAYAWYKEKIDNPLKYYGQLLGSIRTAHAKRASTKTKVSQVEGWAL